MSLIRRVTELDRDLRAVLARRVLCAAAGLVFLVFGAAKFTAHEQGVFSTALGATEIALGILLVAGAHPRLARLGTISMLVVSPPANALFPGSPGRGFFFKDVLFLALGIALAIGFGERYQQGRRYTT